jgi:hypothetical protein
MLNVKTQEVMLKEETIDDLTAKLEEQKQLAEVNI